ncbi:sigma-54 interaction domain-containing protein [Sinanaerobacter chloroacetimidivorans]|uniref:Sigma 54-interacting transcriptional regulator n=1 Tax=Sinanaerobacter chloroacetimidivorans TaxID=2818044 RepID=A0A8J8B174_9FIRM|nr:sigma 54-interacting transcriptional regulator [Sinanaerobacter chloroacetimidivorans]MBR0597356.1 sigma 54-interacting transcriptional regulator [Sinanaerobacter chloroacetimidivorans]
MDALEQKYLKKIVSAGYESEFYKVMVEYLGEEIFVADGTGKILFVNPASVKTIGLPVDQIVGRNAEDFEKEGYFSVSSTMEVIRQRKSINVLQKLKNGKTVLATGVPIFDKEQDEIVMVISTSKDVDAVNELLHTVEKQAMEIEKNKAEIHNLRESMFEAEGFISGDPIMQELKNTVARVAPLEVSVLIQGETGVGKEVVARSLHKFSNRSNEPYIKINCGTIPEQLIESELFGYEKGAFTGANLGGKKGKVEMAHMGTLFLDEIGELPLTLQVKLLDFLQDGTFTRVGGTERIKVNARVVAATNRDLKRMCEEGKFRKDLYYRLNVIPINIPPLRDRPGDIDVLTKYFVSRNNSKYRCHKILGNGLLEILIRFDWPGNVRELENVMERAFVMSDEQMVTKEDIKKILYGDGGLSEIKNLTELEIMPLKEAKWALEKQLVSKAYKMYNSTYKVAAVLQVDQSTVVKLLHKHKCIP